jgi:predicted secreted protein
MRSMTARPGDEEVEATGQADQPIGLPIWTGPATGYEWQLSLPAEVQRIEDGPARPVDPARRLGAAQGGQIRVTAPSGDHQIEARLARPWDPDHPLRVLRIRLRVG